MDVRDDEVSSLDLAFVVDTTGSMTGLIASAQQRMVAMIDALLRADEVSLRLGIVEYRDHPPQDPLPFRAYDFTDDLAAARETLNGLTANGGGDGPESVLDGVLAAVRELAWRPHARRLAVLVGDSPPHGVGARGDGFPQGCLCGETIESVTAAAEDARITFYAFGLTSGVESSFGAISNLTGGEFFAIWRGGSAGQDAIESLQAILVEEFGNLAFDRTVLAARREHPDDSLDELATRLASNRPAVSASVSRLGARGLLHSLSPSPMGEKAGR
jgi:von Willebrand factor type A domain